MSTAATDETLKPEIELLSRSFQELIVARGALRLQIIAAERSKLSLRRLRKAEKAIQRQALNILTDLHALGLSRSEVGAIYRKAELEDTRRNGAVQV